MILGVMSLRMLLFVIMIVMIMIIMMHIFTCIIIYTYHFDNRKYWKNMIMIVMMTMVFNA